MAGYIGNKAVGLNVTTGDILGDVGVGGDVTVGDDLLLNSDSAVLNIGADNDLKITHDGTNGDFESAGNLTFDVAGDIILDADGGDILIKDGGTHVGSIGSAGSGTELFIGSEGTNGNGLYFSNGNRLVPMKNLAVSNGTQDLGHPSFLFKDLYLSGGAFIGGAGAANKLDDYEEGDYTATITCGSGTITLHSSYNQLAYTKIGRAVTINGRIHIASVSSPSGTAVFNLPFVVATGTDHSTYGGLNIYHHDINLGSGGIGLFGESTPGGSVSQINLLKNNAQWATQVANIFDGGDEWMYLAGTYFTSA